MDMSVLPSLVAVYCTQDEALRINVAAARMALFAGDPRNSDRWCRESGALVADPDMAVAGVGLFPGRAGFGRHVRQTLHASAQAAALAQVRHVRDRATAVTREQAGFRVALRRGGSLVAGVLVLAPGDPGTEPPAPLQALSGDGRLLADPWDEWALAGIAPNARVLIVGTGLTMADVLASLRGSGIFSPLVAVSRQGLLPRSRTTTRSPRRPTRCCAAIWPAAR